MYDAVALEGIQYTLPEIQTLLEGITVGGHRQSDQSITLNQAHAWQYLFQSIEAKQFTLSKPFVCALHSIAGKKEALTWGKFRTGGVTIAGTQYLPPDAASLDTCWNALIAHAENISNIYDRAIYIFLQMARNQFFYDVNKRMGRFAMNGVLLQAGYPAINLPATKKETFNRLMLNFYDSIDVAPMTDFMKSCADPNILKIMCE